MDRVRLFKTLQACNARALLESAQSDLLLGTLQSFSHRTPRRRVASGSRGVLFAWNPLEANTQKAVHAHTERTVHFSTVFVLLHTTPLSNTSTDSYSVTDSQMNIVFFKTEYNTISKKCYRASSNIRVQRKSSIWEVWQIRFFATEFIR